MTGMLLLCGFPSSGTDLLKTIVSAHEDIALAGEFPFLPRLADRFGPTVRGDEVPAVAAALRDLDIYRNLGAPDADLGDLSARPEVSVAEIYGRLLGPERVPWKGNKTPQNTENIERLDRLFPEARFILIVRDVRDVALSWAKKWGKDPVLCAAKWDERMRRGHEALLRLPEERRMVLKYEDLIRDPGAAADAICRFVGVPPSERMHHHHEHVDAVVEGKLNYGRPVIPTNAGKWLSQMPRAQALRIEEIAYRGLELFGYEIHYAQGPRPITGFERLRGRARDAAAMILVDNRAIPLHRRLPSVIQAVRVEMRKGRHGA